MKTTKAPRTTRTETALKPAANDTPKYYLADVPQHVRSRVLDLCTRRYYHEALKLLRMHSITHYTYDDLLSFYDWAPAELPLVGRGVPAKPPAGSHSVDPGPRDYSQPSPELIADIRDRLAQLPPEVLERAHTALKHDSIEAVASLLWKAGVGFSSADLYEYRKTLFPPNAMVNAYTSGPP